MISMLTSVHRYFSLEVIMNKNNIFLTYSTSQTAKIVGLHPNTVRMYEEWGE